MVQGEGGGADGRNGFCDGGKDGRKGGVYRCLFDYSSLSEMTRRWKTVSLARNVPNRSDLI